jgi:Glycosyltransferase family 36
LAAQQREFSPRVGEGRVELRYPTSRSPEIHLLSNGRYRLAITNGGGGYSRWRNLAVNRWREDATCDCWGTFVYLRDAATAEFWSAAYQPTLRPIEHYEVISHESRLTPWNNDPGHFFDPRSSGTVVPSAVASAKAEALAEGGDPLRRKARCLDASGSILPRAQFCDKIVRIR